MRLSLALAPWLLLLASNTSATETLTPRAAPSCNIVGTQKNTSPYRTCSQPTQEACAEECQKDAGCTMYAFGATRCSLYRTATVPKNVRSGPNSCSAMKFSDRLCYKAPVAAPKPPPSAPNAVMLPKQDPAIKRDDARNLLPQPKPTLVYAQQSPGTYMMRIAASMKPKGKAVLLENIKSIAKVTCGASEITVEFSSKITMATAVLAWQKGVVLMTLSTGCNPSNERGVYIVQGRATSIGSGRAKFPVAKAALKDVVTEMEITYGHYVGGAPKYTRTATSYFGVPTSSVATSSTVRSSSSSVSVSVSPTGSSSTTASSTASSTLSSTLSTTATSSTTDSSSTTTDSSSTTATSITSDARTTTDSSTTSFTSSTASSSSSSALATTSVAGDSSPAPLSPETQAVLDEIVSNLPAPDADGTVNVPIERKLVQPAQMVLGAEPFNSDPAYQAELQNAMNADGLDTPEAVVNQAVEGLGGDETPNVDAESAAQLADSGDQDMGDAYWANLPEATLDTTEAKRDELASRTVDAPLPASAALAARNVVSLDPYEAQLHDLMKRGDGWDTFFDVMGDDFVGEICKACELVAAGKALYDLGKCIFGGSCFSPPQVTITSLLGTASQEFSLSSKFTEGLIYRDSKASIAVTSEGAGIEMSSLKIEGKVKVTPKQANFEQNFVVSADVSVTQTVKSTALYNIRLSEASSGSWDKAAASRDVQSFTVPNVFTLSAKASWGIGMSWQSDGPIDVKAGAVMITNRGEGNFNVKGRFVTSSSNWEPTSQVTYPKFTKPGRAVISPYVKTDIKISMMIFGKMITDAVVLTNQNNMAFDSQVLSSTENLRKRSVFSSEISARRPSELVAVHAHEKRSFWSNIIRAVQQAQGNFRNLFPQAAPPKTCDAGSMKLNAVVKTRTTASVAGDKKDLFSKDYKFGAQCIPFAKPASPSVTSTSAVPSATSTAPSTTSTIPSNPSNVPTPVTCGNEGLQWALYTDQTNPNVNLDAMRSTPAQSISGVTTHGGPIGTIRLGGGFWANLPRTAVYNQVLPTVEYYAINHQGYLYARMTGEYVFNMGRPDDIVLLWVGDKAKSDWRLENADLISAFTDAEDKIFRIRLTAGQYYPIRMVFGQNSGPQYFELGITDPEGNAILSGTSGASPWIVQYSCDRVAAPGLPAWGSS